MTNGPAKAAFSTTGVVLAAGLVLLIVVGLAAWFLWPKEFTIGRDFSIEDAVAQIRSWGHWAALGSIALMVALIIHIVSVFFYW